MCFDERNTDSRARPRPASLILRRTVAVRRAVRSVNLDMARPLLLLSFLAEDVLVGVSHALALVGLGRTESPDFGGDMPDLLLVDSRDHDLGWFRRCNRDAFRNRKIDVVRKAELQLQGLALHSGAITDAGNLQPLFETFSNARHHVGDQRARRAPHRTRALCLVARLELDSGLVHGDRDVLVHNDLEGAFRPLHFDGLALDVGGDAGRDHNCFIADARHQNTVQMISPPTLASRASWSAITPLGVDKIATPRPLLMRGKLRTAT